MKQELPNLVDERRFRRRETEQVERDEFGRVRSIFAKSYFKVLTLCSENGQRRRSLSISSLFPVSTYVLKLSVTVVRMLSTFNRKPDAVYRSKDVAPASWNTARAVKVMKTCICMLRKFIHM
jgi:hypothetical protein